MAGKIVRLHGKGEEGGATVTFDMAIVPNHVHALKGTCPYCEVKDSDYVVDYIDMKQTDKQLDLIQCAECEEIYMVVDNPLLIEAKGPIMTKWHVVDDSLQ